MWQSISKGFTVLALFAAGFSAGASEGPRGVLWLVVGAFLGWAVYSEMRDD